MRPPKTAIATKPSAHSIGVSSEMFPPRSVASQLKTFTAIGTASASAVSMKTTSNQVGRPAVNMCSPQRDEAQAGDHDDRAHDRAVAEDRLAREDGDDLRDDPERGQDQRVDLRVGEEPEEVLVEQRVAAAGRVEEVGLAVAVEREHRQHGREPRQRDARAPTPKRAPTRRTAASASSSSRGARSVWIVTTRLIAPSEAADREHVQAEDPEVLPVARRVQRRERRVRAPAGRRRAALGEEAERRGRRRRRGRARTRARAGAGTPSRARRSAAARGSRRGRRGAGRRRGRSSSCRASSAPRCTSRASGSPRPASRAARA